MATEQAELLTLYSRDNCHLCHVMIEALRKLQGLLHFELAVVDVDSDPELARRYGECIPVLMHGERELCRTALDAGAVTAYLSDFR